MKKIVLVLTVLSVLAFSSMVGAARCEYGFFSIGLPGWTEGESAMHPGDLETGEYRLFAQWEKDTEREEEGSWNEEASYHGFIFGGDMKFEQDLRLHADVVYFPKQDVDYYGQYRSPLCVAENETVKGSEFNVEVAKGLGNDSYVYVGGTTGSVVYEYDGGNCETCCGEDEEYKEKYTEFYIGVEYFGSFLK